MNDEVNFMVPLSKGVGHGIRDRARRSLCSATLGPVCGMDRENGKAWKARQQ